MADRTEGNIAVLSVQGQNIPEAWGQSALAVWDKGMPIRTQYDHKTPQGEFLDSPSRAQP